VNYLAHAALAEPTDDARLGSLLGDFRRGLEPERFPEATRYALHEHVALDAYFDRLPAVRACRATFPRRLRRFGGVLIDVFVDHALTRCWGELMPDGVAVDDVAQSLYRGLERRADDLPPRLARIAPSLVGDDWLGSYRDLRNIERALRGIASRLSRPTPLAEGIEVLRARRHEFDDLARETVPTVRAWLRARRIADGRTIVRS